MKLTVCELPDGREDFELTWDALCDHVRVELPRSRGRVADALTGILLLLPRERPPRRDQLGRIALVAIGVVFGFPLFAALALQKELQNVPSAHGAVIVGLSCGSTAVGVTIFSAVDGESPEVVAFPPHRDLDDFV